MTESLQSHKRQVVRDAIYDAAIDLFAQKGFDETTIEEVAKAAGISRRSFFRHFESKDDLLALNTVHCGEVLFQTVASCPAGLSPLGVVRETVLAGLRFTEAQPRTHLIIEISLKSASARQAHLSRLMEVEDKVAAAFAARFESASPYSTKPALLAGMCQLLVNVAIAPWFFGEHKDLSAAATDGFLSLKEMFSDEPAASSDVEASHLNKAPSPAASRKALLARKVKRPGRARVGVK